MKALGAICLMATLAAAQPAGWLARNYNNTRSGWNPQETKLTQASVAQHGLVRLPSIPVAGDARGMEAQPLILPAVRMKDGNTHNVMVLPSMANIVRGVDAETGAGLWQTTLSFEGKPFTPVQGPFAADGKTNIDLYRINDHWGCLSTGVIDPDTKVWYSICQGTPDGTGHVDTSRMVMFGLNLTDGTQAFKPVMLTGSANGVEFNGQWRKMRSAAALYKRAGHKVVIQCGGSVFMTRLGNGGFCFAFDTATNTFSNPFATTEGQAGNVWNSGSGPAISSDGSIFVLTATGNFDGVKNFGESLLKLSYGDGFHVLDHWTPYADQGRTGQPMPDTLVAGATPSTDSLKVPVNGHAMDMRSFAGAKIKSNVNAQGQAVQLVYPAPAKGAWADEDLGSAGPACIEAVGVCLVGGKDGILYPVKMGKLGGTTRADLKNPKGNCAKLAAPPVWSTVDPGAVDPCPTNPETLNFMPWGATAHLHMTPVQMYDPLLKSWTVFVWGENQQLHKWAVSSTGKLTYVAQSHEYASADVRSQPGGGMPGGFCSGSGNGNDPDSMLLVCSVPYGDGNKSITGGRLLVYDPVHTAADGGLKVLWDSQRWGLTYTFNKFMPPVIWNGQIYLPDYSGSVLHFALNTAP